MRYEIGYSSTVWNTQRIALALKDMFDEQDCCLIDIDSQEPTLDADIYLIGFAVRYHTCPFAVLEWLEQLEGKTIILFGLSALEAFPGYRDRLESQIKPFLPTDCEYMGLHLCPSRMTNEEYSYLENQLKQNGKQKNLDSLQQMFNDSLYRPEDGDIAEVIDFVRERLSNS